jgi:hypothetical protein
MANCRILYFRGRILEATDEVASADLVEAARVASSRHPNLTAEIWRKGKKVAILRLPWGIPHQNERPEGCAEIIRS